MCMSATEKVQYLHEHTPYKQRVTVYGATVRHLKMQSSSLVTITEMTMLTFRFS